MKAVLISIQPKWCELIASGKKTVEVRKTKPKIETPFKVYIYCTKDKERSFFPPLKKLNFKPENYVEYVRGNGKVIGEFVCDEIIVGKPGSYCKIPLQAAQLDADSLMDYADEKTVYGWHISDLVIYDKPKELREFSRHDNSYDNAFGWAFEDRTKNIPITRPPQSWCYVERLGEG